MYSDQVVRSRAQCFFFIIVLGNLYCKRYLEVSSKVSNVACRAELGRFPLIIAINQKIINYTLYLHNKENDSIVKQIFLMSYDLHNTSKNSFYSNVMRMSEYYNLPDFDPTFLRLNTI